MKKIFEKISLRKIHSNISGDWIEIEIKHKNKIIQRLILGNAELGRFIAGEKEVEIIAEVY
jgi:hypothetical protein